jgi:hypothetical protein
MAVETIVISIAIMAVEAMTDAMTSARPELRDSAI